MEQFLQFTVHLLGLVPAVALFAPLIALVVDFLKRAGALPDGYAPLASGVLNLLAYALVWFAGESKDMTTIVNAVTALAPYIFALFLSLLATARAHKAAVGIGIGYSHAKG